MIVQKKAKTAVAAMLTRSREDRLAGLYSFGRRKVGKGAGQSCAINDWWEVEVIPDKGCEVAYIIVAEWAKWDTG